MDNRQITCIDTGEIVVGYENYLKTKHWFNLRRLIVTKDSRCSACGAFFISGYKNQQNRPNHITKKDKLINRFH